MDMTVSSDILDWLCKNKELDKEAAEIVDAWRNGKPLNVDDAVVVSLHTGVPFGYFFLDKAPDQHPQTPPSNELSYRNMHTHIYYDAADAVLYGKIEDIKQNILFRSESAVEIKKEFERAVDQYFQEQCK